MFAFNEFCKEKKCKYYKEEYIAVGMSRCCTLRGLSFYITTFPDNCIHLEEIKARQDYEKNKHDTWKRLTKKSPGEELRHRMNQWGGVPKKYRIDPKDIL